MAWKPRDPSGEVVAWPDNQRIEIEGELVSVKWIKAKGYQENVFYTLRTHAGELRSFFGSTGINDRMGYHAQDGKLIEGSGAIQRGQWVQVVSTGQSVTTPRGRMKLFEVNEWEGETEGTESESTGTVQDEQVPF